MTINIDVIGVPLDYGAGRRGVDMGPSAIRYAGLREGLQALSHQVCDLGNLSVPLTETCDPGDPQLKYLAPIVEVGQRLASSVEASIAQGHVPLVLGGDHSLSLASVAGAARGRRLGLIWFDAHGDFNTAETTPSGNVHGMPLAVLLGYGDKRLRTLGGVQHDGSKFEPQNVVIVGARDLDGRERLLLADSGVHVFGMDTIDRWGFCETMERAIQLTTNGTEGLWLSLDIDGVDPMWAPGVGTPVSGGLTYREAHLAVELIAETRQLVGMDVVEVNPILDLENKTGRLAVELTLSAFGKRIWDSEHSRSAKTTNPNGVFALPDA